MADIWHGTLDDKYLVRVVRIDSDKGKFTINEGDKVLLSEEVPLFYGAVYGADISDIQSWMEKAAQFIDNKG